MSDGGQPLGILMTFDIEVWCGSWQNIDERFPAAFRRYVYGTSPAGQYALPKTLEILNDHGLKGVFFVEPLFAAHFGIEPLAEIVHLIREAGQEVQLHVHPEWQDEARTPLIAKHAVKRQHLFMYDAEEQTALIGHGLRLLKEAGAGPINAFRAGSYACNADTFVALAQNGIRYDSSLNLTMDYSGAGLPTQSRRLGCHGIGDVVELPVSVFRSAAGGLRHAQVGACAYLELRQAMYSALRAGWRQFVVVSHNFEMLQQDHVRPDWVVVRRFRNLCRFLERHRDAFPTMGFNGSSLTEERDGLELPKASLFAYVSRNAEQLGRRVMKAWPC